MGADNNEPDTAPTTAHFTLSNLSLLSSTLIAHLSCGDSVKVGSAFGSTAIAVISPRRAPLARDALRCLRAETNIRVLEYNNPDRNGADDSGAFSSFIFLILFIAYVCVRVKCLDGQSAVASVYAGAIIRLNTVRVKDRATLCLAVVVCTVHPILNPTNGDVCYGW